MAAPYPTKELKVLRGHQGAVLCVRYNQDGNYCVSGGADKTIRLWNPIKGTQLQTYRGHGWEVYDIDVSVDNSRIASCGGDRMVFLWDVTSSKVIRKFRGHDSKVNCIRFNQDSGVLVTGSYDKTVKIWDCKSNSWDPIQVLDHAKDSVNSVLVSKDEIFAASVDGSVRTYDIRNGVMTVDSVGQPINSVKLSNDNNCLLLGCLDDKVRLIDRGSGDLLNEYKGHKNSNYKVESCLSNDDAYVLSGSEDGIIYIWDLVNANMVSKLQGHSKTICSISFHPKDVGLLSASTDETIRVWK